MSGGNWNYIQNQLIAVIDDITDVIEKNGKKVKNRTFEWEDEYYSEYSEETIKRFKEARLNIAEAREHIQRLDWLFYDDDGENSYLEKLDKNLKKIRKKYS